MTGTPRSCLAHSNFEFEIWVTGHKTLRNQNERKIEKGPTDNGRLQRLRGMCIPGIEDFSQPKRCNKKHAETSTVPLTFQSLSSSLQHFSFKPMHLTPFAGRHAAMTHPFGSCARARLSGESPSPRERGGSAALGDAAACGRMGGHVIAAKEHVIGHVTLRCCCCGC